MIEQQLAVPCGVLRTCAYLGPISIITGRNEVLAKVMFLHVSVILLTGGGYLTRHPPGRYPPPGRHPPQAGTPPGIRSTLGRYASYWNAFLFSCSFPRKPCKVLGFCPKLRGWRTSSGKSWIPPQTAVADLKT